MASKMAAILTFSTPQSIDLHYGMIHQTGIYQISMEVAFSLKNEIKRNIILPPDKYGKR